jgi:hypothetical protein
MKKMTIYEFAYQWHHMEPKEGRTIDGRTFTDCFAIDENDIIVFWDEGADATIFENWELVEIDFAENQSGKGDV